jgi:hypothetical protein
LALDIAISDHRWNSLHTNVDGEVSFRREELLAFIKG